ncbi:MAG: hypothetical protein EB078_05455, partial [Proteobacteria bacterium]|nr:hypothetical protein [Pseudomonadota bacterium]NDD04330.1 hypothetical protein [Pseudomonadota bacterium]NDG28102.1 hypothetical protein [Pseudomonadota bacterium]
PVADMAEIINSIQDSNTSFWEQGLENSYQAVFKNKSKFMRSGVPLIVVYLTDEDDYSCQGHCWGVEPENNPDWISFDASRYIDFFKTVKASEKSDVIVFPIVGVNQTNCQVSSVGQRYMALSEAIGNQGKTGSVCDLDLPASYNNIAQIIADRGNVFRLDTPASGQNIRVFVDGALLSGDPANYIFDAEQNSIVITGALPKPGSIIEVTFEQSQTN